MNHRLTISAVGFIVFADAAAAQSATDWSVLERARTNTPKPTSTAISVDDLKSRLYQFSDDSMRGRQLGDIGNVKGTAYIASELKRLGLEPAGDNGGYFQLVPVVQSAFDERSTLRLGDQSFEAWKDYVPRDNPGGGGTRSVDGVATVYGGVWGDQAKMISREAATGKVVILTAKPDETGAQLQGLPNRGQVMTYFQAAAAVMVVGRENLPAANIEAYKAAGDPTLPNENAKPIVAYLYITKEIAKAVFGVDPASLAAGTAGRSFTGNAAFVGKPMTQPTYNVVGIIRGSDAALKNEYVAIGAHNDHVGIEHDEPAAHDSTYVVNHLFREQGADAPPPKLTRADADRVNALLAEIRKKTNGASARIDSVYNGADDDGTGSMSVLELAEYFAGQRAKPRRSMLFIWHVGEEEGLFGSEYFTDHPTVPRESIVTELNIDMIGRGDASDVTGETKDKRPIHGGEGYVQLIGSRRLSTELGDLAEKVNKDKKHNLAFDYSLDADGHQQNIYCRSDHYSYARYGIPIVFFTTGGHADYHQLTDEPQYINYAHMTKVVNFVRDLAIETANLDHRPKVDKPKPDPHGACQQ